MFPFNKSSQRMPSITLSVKGVEIPLSDTIKYLEIVFDKKLTFRHNILKTCEKAIKCGRAPFPLLNRKSTLNSKNKILLYKMYIRPITTYVCQIWSTRRVKSYLKKL